MPLGFNIFGSQTTQCTLKHLTIFGSGSVSEENNSDPTKLFGTLGSGLVILVTTKGQ